jgi:hypothetical protein
MSLLPIVLVCRIVAVPGDHGLDVSVGPEQAFGRFRHMVACQAVGAELAGETFFGEARVCYCEEAPARVRKP